MEVAEWALEKAERSLGFLCSAHLDRLDGWSNSGEERVPDQFAQCCIARMWHPHLCNDRNTRERLADLRKMATEFDPSLLYAELADAHLRDDTNRLIELHEKHLTYLERSPDPVHRERATLLRLSWHALRESRTPEPDLMKDLFGMPPDQIVALLLREKGVLLPRTRDLIRTESRNSLPPGTSLRIFMALEVLDC